MAADKGADKAMADEYGQLDSGGDCVIVDELPLDSGKVMKRVECRYKTWGEINSQRSNCIVVCHALTGNADASSWWGSLIGPGRPIDTNQYFVFCSNVLGSCYGTTGPQSINPDTGKRYGGDFPSVSIRDMVRLQQLVLRKLGVIEIVCIVGGSMGGMQALEFAIDVTQPRIRSIISLCSSGRHQPWQIGIGECQREAIRADPNWQGGNYPPERPPINGLAVARMMAMLTYRSHPAYRTKFGREVASNPTHSSQVFDVEQYLHHQGERFHDRKFDAMSYIVLTRAMDLHDVAEGRGDYFDVLSKICLPALIVSISSDVLYPPCEQLELAEHMPGAQHHMIQSDEGHDGFLLESSKVGVLVRGFLGEFHIGESAQSPPICRTMSNNARSRF